MISIIIPVHNQADKIGATLQSILNQSYTDWELIVVDDGSTDDIKTVIEKWKEKFSTRRLYFFSKENEGSNPTRNFGFDHSHGEFVIFCDADIVMKKDMLEKMRAKLEEHPAASFCYSAFYYGRKIFRLCAYDEERLRRMPYIHTTSLIRREHFPGFDPAIRRFQDWDLWLTMLTNGHRGVWISEALFTAQLGGGHFSAWVPKITYKIMPFLPVVKRYKESMGHIKRKHNLS